MAEGKVKWFNTRKGYGFIATGEGADIFVHYSNIVSDGYRMLVEGDAVTFDVVEGEKGRRAENVVSLSKSKSKTAPRSKPAEESKAATESEAVSVSEAAPEDEATSVSEAAPEDEATSVSEAAPEDEATSQTQAAPEGETASQGQADSESK
jgi:CspA family cold shock protein